MFLNNCLFALYFVHDIVQMVVLFLYYHVQTIYEVSLHSLNHIQRHLCSFLVYCSLLFNIRFYLLFIDNRSTLTEEEVWYQQLSVRRSRI